MFRIYLVYSLFIINKVDILCVVKLIKSWLVSLEFLLPETETLY